MTIRSAHPKQGRLLGSWLWLSRWSCFSLSQLDSGLGSAALRYSIVGTLAYSRFTSIVLFANCLITVTYLLSE